MHFPQLFILAITVRIAPYGAKALVTEGNDRAAFESSVASMSALQGTNETGLGASPLRPCDPGWGRCPGTVPIECCPLGGRCCPERRFPDRSLNSRSMIHILV